MKRVNQIIQHEVFIRELKKLNRLERDRMYCRHDIDHLLSVARVAYITALEEGLPLKKDVIYGAALTGPGRLLQKQCLRIVGLMKKNVQRF